MNTIVTIPKTWCYCAHRLVYRNVKQHLFQGQFCHARLFTGKTTTRLFTTTQKVTYCNDNNADKTQKSVPLALPIIAPSTTAPTVYTKPIVNEISKSLTVNSHPTLGQVQNGKDSRFLPAASRLLYHYLMLSKIRLTSLVVMTTMAGYAMAPAPFELSTFLLCSIGTTLVSGAANSINQVIETSFDAQMARTKNRVLVKGYLSRLHAVGFALGASTIGLTTLYLGVNEITALLGAANLILYTSIYTPMKRYSILNTWVGSLVGAIPPIMGWAACTGGDIGAGAWLLAGLLYCWQFPHFNALSWNIRPEYLKAGYKMMANSHPRLCTRVSLRHTGYISVISLAAPALDVTNYWFALESLPLNAYFSYLAWEFHQKADSKSSRKLFRFSLLHLPLLMLLFLLNKNHWIFFEEKPEDAIIGVLLDKEGNESKPLNKKDAYLIPNIVAEVGNLATTNGVKTIEDNLLTNVAGVLPAQGVNHQQL